jgi:hypothetical protein
MKTLLENLKPSLPKRYLIFVAGLVWSFAGAMLLAKGVGMLVEYMDEIWIKLLISLPLGIIFYVFMFSKVFSKHSERILAIKHEKPCIFSFFNWKAYLMMGSMIGLGVFLRTSGLVSTRYLSLLYITMGIPLSISAIMFFMNGIQNFNSSK